VFVETETVVPGAIGFAFAELSRTSPIESVSAVACGCKVVCKVTERRSAERVAERIETPLSKLKSVKLTEALFSGSEKFTTTCERPAAAMAEATVGAVWSPVVRTSTCKLRMV